MNDFRHVPIEKVREFWDLYPCNINHSAKAFGTKEFFDEVEQRKYFVEPHIQYFADFKRWEGKKVLEIGCGIGTDTINFARCGALATAVDVSARSLDIARKRAEVFGLQDKIRFYSVNAEELNSVVPIEPYDLIYAFGSLHHVPNPKKAIQGLRHYAGKDTRLKIMIYNRQSWKVMEIFLKYGKGKFWRLPELVAQHSEASIGSPVTYTFCVKEAKRMLQECGFKPVQLSIEHIFPYRIREYRQYRYVRVWYFRFMPKWFFHWLEHCLGWHICLTARLL